MSQEKNSKAARLREACRLLQLLPLDKIPSEAEWQTATGDLSSLEVEHLKKLAEGYRERALEGPEEGLVAEHLEEAGSAIQLWPRDPEWARSTLEAYQGAGWKGPEVEAFLATLRRRAGKKGRGTAKGRRPRWMLPVALGLILVPSVIVLLVVFGIGWSRSASVSPVQGPRNLEAVFDTQGVKANVQVAQSRMLLFPDATVAEVSAWVMFPEHRVELWEGVVTVLDAQGLPLTHRDVVFRSSSEGPLEPGQGVSIFEQFDAHPFYDQVTSFQISTTRILAEEANPTNRKEFKVKGVDSLTSGYNLKVWVVEERWDERFASKVHTLKLDIENSGLKPFAELQFTLVWRDTHGKTLKSLVLRPVSPFKTALPSGAQLPVTQETVFDTEVFQWEPGSEPFPTLELKQWQ